MGAWSFLANLSRRSPRIATFRTCRNSMRITLTYVILEIVRRYGAIPLFIVIVIASVLALRFLSKVPGRSHHDTLLGFGVFLCSVALAFALAPAAWNSGVHLFQVVRGAL